MPGNSSAKKKTKYLGHFWTESNKFFFKWMRNVQSFIWCQKFLHILLESVTIHINTNLSLFTIPSKTFSSVSFFIASISFSILFFNWAISLTFVFYTFVLMYPHRKQSRGVKSGECVVQEIGPPLPIHLLLNFSFNHVRTSLNKNNSLTCEDNFVHWLFHLQKSMDQSFAC